MAGTRTRSESNARAEPSTEDGVLIASTIDNLHGNGLTNFSLCHSSLSIAVEYRRRVGGNNFLRTLHSLAFVSLAGRCISAVATRTNCNLTVAKKGLRPKEPSEGEERRERKKGNRCSVLCLPPPPRRNSIERRNPAEEAGGARSFNNVISPKDPGISAPDRE